MIFNFFKKILLPIFTLVSVASVQAAFQPAVGRAKFVVVDAEAAIKEAQNNHGFLNFFQTAYKDLTSTPTFAGSAIAGLFSAAISIPVVGFLFENFIKHSGQPASSLMGAAVAIVSGCCVGLGVFGAKYWQSAEMMCWRASNEFSLVIKHVSNDSFFMGDIAEGFVRGYISQRFNDSLSDAIKHYQNISAAIIEIECLLQAASHNPEIKAQCDRLKKEVKRCEIRLSELLTVLKNL